MYGLVAILVLIGLAMAGYFTRTLSRAYRREAEALETTRRALASRDEIMAIVAHDLRTPLGSMMLMSALLGNETADEKARDRARTIENIAARMELLIKTLLDVATIEAKRLSIKPEACAADDLVRETIGLFEPQATTKHIRLVPNVAERDLIIRADRDRVLQVLSNLVGNAVKFTPKNGTVTLAVTREGRNVRFAVCDTGPGIDPDHLPHVFDRFWRHETRGLKGTGLGLFIAKSIVEAHGGTILADSKLGFGATFSFTLELADTGARATPTEIATSPPGPL
jgi:signal transduction histidine kinase